MPVMPTTLEELKKKQITLADYLLMPELNHPYEIIDGEMVPSPASNTHTSNNRCEHLYPAKSVCENKRARCGALRTG